MERYIILNTQKQNRAKKYFGKDFHKLVNEASYGKKVENFTNKVKKEIIRREDNEKIIEQQPKLTFSGIQKISTNFDS